MNTAEYLCKTLSLPALETAPGEVPAGTRCLMTGKPLDFGYWVWDVIPDSTGEFIDLLGGQTVGYVAAEVGEAWKGMWNVGLVFCVGEYGYRPLISRKAALEQKRMVLADLIALCANVPPQQCLIIINTDPKKRVWPRARVSSIGPATSVYVHDNSQNISGNLVVNWKKLVEYMRFIEEVYKQGFSKPSIATNVMSNLKQAQAYGMKNTVELERVLSTMRHTNEFSVAIIAAQKDE